MAKPNDFTPVQAFPSDHRSYGLPRCQCWSKSRQAQCLNVSINGTQACGIHGGKSKRGPDHPNFQHGRRDKTQFRESAYTGVGDTTWADDYQRFTEHAANLSLADDIALNQARINAMLRNIDTEIPKDFLKNLQKLIREVYEAITSDPSGVKMLEKLGLLRELINNGVSEVEKQEHLDKLIAQRTILTGRQSRYLKDQQSMMATTTVMKLMFSMWSSVKTIIESNADDQTANLILDAAEEKLDQMILYTVGSPVPLDQLESAVVLENVTT